MKSNVSARADGGAWELYDLGRDRAESDDLAHDLPWKVRELGRLWLRKARQFVLDAASGDEPRRSTPGNPRESLWNARGAAPSLSTERRRTGAAGEGAMGFMPAGLSKGGDDSTDDTDEVVPGPELLEDPLGETTASLHVASGRERTEPEPAAGTVKKVAGRIGDDGLTVELTGEADAPPGLTFHVLGGDSLEWNFRNVPPGARVQVQFDGFQADPDKAHGAGFVTLFERQPPVSAPAGGDRTTAVSSEPVRSRSFPGTYWYTVALLRPDAPPVVLQCVWNGTPVAAGGGEKSGRPTS